MDRTEWVVIGAGLNVNNSISQSLSSGAASLYGLTGHVGSRARSTGLSDGLTLP
jgi:biotin-(acetyl-CoA carboxylase) ligase